MAEVVQFINNNDKATYRSLYDTEIKGRKESERIVSDGNPSVVIRRNKSRSNELEVVKTYELTDDELVQRACGELNIMRRIHKQDADICAAKLYEWRLICADGRTLISTRDRPDDDAEEMLNAVDPLKAAEMEENNPFNRAQTIIKKGYKRLMDEVSRIEIVMEYGVSLMDFMNAQKSIEAPDQKIRLLFKALRDLHNIGIVHEDIKPSNIILVEKARNVVPVFIDFDVSALHNVYHIPFAPYNGSTAYYESPEQVGEVECDPDTVDENGKPQLTPKTDVYSMGVIAFDLLGTHLPEVRDERKQFVSKHKADSKTHEVLANALVKSPGTRYDAGGILNGLMEVLGEIPIPDGIQEVVEAVGPFGKLLSMFKNLFKSNKDDGRANVLIVKIRDIIFHNSAVAIVAIVALGLFFGYLTQREEKPIPPALQTTNSEVVSTTTDLPSLTTTSSPETTSPLSLTTTVDPTTAPPEIPQTTTTTLAATTTSRPFLTERPYTPPPPIDPPTPERTEPAETTTVTQTEPPTDPPTDPPIIEGVDANGLAYRIENGTATITGYQGTATEVVIPEYVAGVPVYAIGANAFANTEIASVELLAGVQRIEAEAFRGCTYLQQVILPISIKYIGPDAFTRNYDADNIIIYYRDSSVGWNQIEKTDADFEKDYIETSFNYGIEW